MPVRAPATRHRRPATLRRDVYVRPRRSSPVAADVLAGNNLVFGPGGEAAIIPDQGIGTTPGSGQATEPADTATEAGLPFSTGAVAVMEPGTGQPSASFADVSLSIGPVSTSPDVVNTMSATASSEAIMTVSSETIPSTTSTQVSSSLSSMTATSFTVTTGSQTPSSSASVSTRMSSNPSGALYADKPGFKVGVSFGALATIGLFVAFVLWRLRARQRTRTQELEKMIVWPWDKETSSGMPSSPAGLETGFAATSTNGDGAHAWSAGCLDRLDAISPTDGRLPTLPPAVHSLNETPYQTVQLHHTNNSVPDLAPNMGALQVTNLVPGDITSGSESSRASSVLSMAFMGHTPIPEYGTPYEPMAGERPRFLGVQDYALPVPWAPLHTQRKAADIFRFKSTSNISEKSVGPLPYPGDVHHVGSAPGGWATSFKTNIVNAFNAVVGGPVQNTSASDNLTTSPQRKKRGWNDGSGIAPSIRSVHSDVKEWPLDEADGIDYLDAHAGELASANSWSSIPLEDAPQKDVAQDTMDGNVGAARDGDDKQLDIIEEYYSEQLQESDPPQVDAHPPRLPDIPQISRTPSLSSLAIVCEGRSQRKSTKFRKGGTRKKTRGSRRPTLVARASSSSCSVGSDISRQSSVRSDNLTDAEVFAKKMLRERRRRVMEMGSTRHCT